MTAHMQRREFLTLLGGAAVGCPFAARAQQAPAPLIGFLSSRSPGESAGVVAAFRQGIREIGFIEGQNLAIAFRWAEGHYGRLPALAAELVGLPVVLLFSAGGPPTAFAAKAATSTIPIVFSAVSDPVEIGLVPSLNQPGGNVTGMGVFNATLGAKRIELTKELMPRAAGIAYLLNPSNPSSEIESKGALAAARALRIELHVLNASTEYELDTAFADAAKLRAGMLVVSGEPYFDSQRERLVALSARHAIAAVYAWREYVLAGGLMSYGTDLPDSYRRAGIYAGKDSQGREACQFAGCSRPNFIWHSTSGPRRRSGWRCRRRCSRAPTRVIE
jgi:putative tryptophan/tyrosine transport system substrate-binding protein